MRKKEAGEGIPGESVAENGDIECRVNGREYRGRSIYRRTLEAYRSRREQRLDYEFLPATLEVLDRPPAPFSRVVLLLIVTLSAVAVLWAPIDGIVQQLVVNTVGGVVTAAQPLMVIVPIDCDLEVEAKVLDKDIGFISQKQDVSVKVTAYPYTRHGDIQGTIEWVARDAVMDEKMGPSYPIRVAIDTYELPNVIHGRRGTIAPGMTVTADIKVGRRRVIEYFIGPIMRYKDESLREM